MSDLDKINDSLAEFESELSDLKSAIEIIENAKEETKKFISESQELMKNFLTESTQSIDRVITHSEKVTSNVIEESKNLNESAKKLYKAVELLMEKLDKVDFPTRLDKIDATVAGINAAIQNIYSKVDSVERTIVNTIEKKNEDLHVYLNENTKKQKIWFIVNVGLLMLVILLMIYFHFIATG
ncbi:MAG: hypothetical protein Kow00108_11440 [Calditrichia bacterium]